MKPSTQILLDAAAHLERHGWLPRGEWQPELGGPCCGFQAIEIVANKRGQLWFEASDRMCAHVGAIDLWGLFEWNDSQTDPAVVIAALRKAAEETADG